MQPRMRDGAALATRDRVLATVVVAVLIAAILLVVFVLPGHAAEVYTSEARVVVSTAELFGGPRFGGRQLVCWAGRVEDLPPLGCVPVAGRNYERGEAIWVHVSLAGDVIGIGHRA